MYVTYPEKALRLEGGSTFITDKGFDIRMFPLDVFSDVGKCVAIEITHTTLVVPLTIMSENISVKTNQMTNFI